VFDAHQGLQSPGDAAQWQDKNLKRRLTAFLFYMDWGWGLSHFIVMTDMLRPHLTRGPVEERRRTKRRPAQGRVVLVHGKDHQAVEAELVDASFGGARIAFDTPLALPEVVYLIDPKTQTLYQCAVSLRSPRAYSLRFLNRHPLAQLPPNLRYLADLWQNLANDKSAFRRRFGISFPIKFRKD
jgi:hypothetical protein